MSEELRNVSENADAVSEEIVSEAAETAEVVETAAEETAEEVIPADEAIPEEAAQPATKAATKANNLLNRRLSVREAKAEVILGIVFIAFSILLFAVIIPTQIKNVTEADWFNHPRLFPNCIAGLIAVLGISSVINGLRARKIPIEQQKEYSISLLELRLVGITLGLLAVYVFAMKWIPYIPATIVILAAMIFLYGQRNYIKIAAVSVGMTVIIYLAFTYLLKLRLP